MTKKKPNTNNHGRKVPRKVRWQPAVNMMDMATARATRYTQAEVATIMQPITQACAALRSGTASKADWTEVASALAIAGAIEDLGVVRGVRGHLDAADQALESIHTRALTSGTWAPTSLSFAELDTINTFAQIARYQLENLSASEYRAAYRRALGQIAGAGGELVEVARQLLPRTYAPTSIPTIAITTQEPA